MRTFNPQVGTLESSKRLQAEPKSTKIFLVDDDKTYLFALGFHLKKEMQHKIYCYETGEECLENLHLNPDVVILDYYLNTTKPDAMNGLDTLKLIKKRKPKTKVIMLSGQETLGIAASSLKLGAFTYVIKDLLALFVVKKVIDEIFNDEGLTKGNC
jgi:two-component system OmpR family response regulator